MNLPEDFEPGMPAEELLDMSDKWVLSELARTAAEVTANLDKYELLSLIHISCLTDGQSVDGGDPCGFTQKIPA